MKVAVIGAGHRLCGMLEGLCTLGVEIAAVADLQPEVVRERLDDLKLCHEKTQFVDDHRQLIDDADQFDGFMIGTRCHLHTSMAIDVAAAGKPLFLEKPIAITQQQVDDLQAAWKGREDQVVVSFPLRVTPVFQHAREIVQSGRLGSINQVQAVNNVSYGEVYFETWYRRFNEVGGLWLQKATHDFDYLNQIVGARPVRVAAMMTQRVFGTGTVLQPDRPLTARLPHIDKHKFDKLEPEDITDASATLNDFGSRFHAGIKNQDAGSAIIWYDNGIIVSYDQNFVTRREAGSRGAIVTGFNGTLEWNWLPTEHIRVVDHDSPRVDRIECPSEGGHGGGDLMLHQAFVDLMQGKPHTAGNLKDGLLSVAMCLAARRAAQQHTVEDIPDFGLFPAAKTTVDPRKIEA